MAREHPNPNGTLLYLSTIKGEMNPIQKWEKKTWENGVQTSSLPGIVRSVHLDSEKNRATENDPDWHIR